MRYKWLSFLIIQLSIYPNVTEQNLISSRKLAEPQKNQRAEKNLKNNFKTNS